LQIIHFTQGACDALRTHDAKGVHFLPLADGQGDTHVACAHLDPGAEIQAPSLTHAAALLVVHGRITIVSERGSTRNINISAGMGAVVEPQEPYTFKSDSGAILLIVEAEQLSAHERGISSPERIAGQSWPSDAVLT
jgi:redox-sensitive bicupin YhaK (pirin superfamily)